MLDRNVGPRGPQAGGITIVVTLMLLVLITIGAMGMSKNAITELSISGTSRQGSMARNVADSGIEWAMYWMFPGNNAAAGATLTSGKLASMMNTLVTNPTMGGVAYDPTTGGLYNPAGLPAPLADTVFPTVNGTTQSFTIGLTSMGKLSITGQSEINGYAPASGGTTGSASIQPDLWAIRSDSQIRTGTFPFATTYYHAKEAWISTQATSAK